MDNVKVASELVKIAKSLVSKKSVLAEELSIGMVMMGLQ